MSLRHYPAKLRAVLTERGIENAQPTIREVNELLTAELNKLSHEPENGTVEKLFFDALRLGVTLDKAKKMVQAVISREMKNAIATSYKRDAKPYAFKFEL